MNLSNITNSTAKTFATEFFIHRNINREIYERIPENKFDFKMTQKSDSPRESLVHQIETQIQYLQAAKNGKLIFGTINTDVEVLKKLSKQALLQRLDECDNVLINLLCDEQTIKNRVSVPWSKNPITAISMLWGLTTHEVLHTGWNLAIMDHLEIERFETLKKVWG